MTGVEYISSDMVQAVIHKAELSQLRVELTPWDLQLLLVGPVQKGLLFPKPQHKNSFINHLKTSLSDTLLYFPPLSGRLATTEHDDEKVSFLIDCNNTGALFIHAKADGVTISDIIEPVYVPSIVHSFFPLNGYKNIEGVSNPLLGVQVTELVDGIFIGITANHSVVDGTSFWHFLNSWSAISRGLIHLPKLPVFQRRFFNSINFPIQIPKSHVQNFHDDFVVPLFKERVFHFSKQSIVTLKARANAEVGTGTTTTTTNQMVQISSLQALLSRLWQSIIRNKNLEPNEDTHYCFIIGGRQRLHDLPQEYFGNVLKTQKVTMKVKQLLEQGVGSIALEMNKVIAANTGEDFNKFIETWIASPELFKMSTMSSRTLITSSSPRFDMYGNDFGWGKPIAVRCGAANKFDGKITLYCGAEEGSIDIEACLSPETLNALGNDEEFMDAIITN
ncbi:putative acetyltransferase [Gossypium australe]|uniref:Putative acetyltransferase n=1 Tax=Gossypium australe TaxID=47621 RepID=A0A5B6W4Q5_9ROSI|nr:putative acetyltransferase [Gossypium australe]